MVNESVQSINQKRNETEAKLNSLKDLIDEEGVRVSDLSDKISSTETRLEQVLSKHETDFQNLVSSTTNQLKIDRDNNEAEFGNKIKEFDKRVNDQISESTNEFDSTRVNFEERAKKTIEELNSKLNDAKRIVGIIGNVGVTGNYQKIADENKKSANYWRVIAIVLMTLMAIILIITLFQLSGDKFDFKLYLLRIISVAILLYPAIYAAKESTKHRNLETLNRSRELELASIEPFIELLPEEKKQLIKESLVERYFGNNQTMINEVKKKSDEELSLGGFEKIANIIMKIGSSK